jgi:hypothetical protein
MISNPMLCALTAQVHDQHEEADEGEEGIVVQATRSVGWPQTQFSRIGHGREASYEGFRVRFCRDPRYPVRSATRTDGEGM